MSAWVASAAIEVRFNAAAVAYRDVCDALADLQNFNAEFVTEYARVLYEWHVPEVTTEVCAANANRANGNECFTLGWLSRLRRVLELECLGLYETKRTHRTHNR